MALDDENWTKSLKSNNLEVNKHNRFIILKTPSLFNKYWRSPIEKYYKKTDNIGHDFDFCWLSKCLFKLSGFHFTT